METILAIAAGTVAALLGLGVAIHRRRSLTHLAFGAGMLVLGARELCLAASAGAVFSSDVLFWHRLRLSIAALIPGFWLTFVLGFARVDAERFLHRWRWVVMAGFVLPVGLALGGWGGLVVGGGDMPTPSWLLPLGGSGYALHVVLLVGSVLILMNLEHTLRASSGSVRWRIKFLLLGVGAIFGIEVYLASQALLYSSIQTTLLPVGSTALLLASLLMVASFLRSRWGAAEVYPSESFVYRSLTLLIVGIYLVLVAGIVEAVERMGGAQRVPLVALLILVALLGLMTILLSTELQQRIKSLLNRHLQRPTHDYRQIWSEFTQRTSEIVDLKSLTAAVAKLTAETFGCSAATIWLLEEGESKAVTLGGSTAISEERGRALLSAAEGGAPLVEAFRRGPDSAQDLWRAGNGVEVVAFFRAAEIRYAVALKSGGELLGFLTVNDRVTGEPFRVEDFALLETLGDQAAGLISNRKLSEQIQRAREMEAFQTLSAFFIHDLKNLASRLSLVMQNLPEHYDNPDFRKDLLKTITTSLGKIDSMTLRLSSATKGLEIRPRRTDLNELVRSTIAGMNGAAGGELSQELAELPPLVLDPDQLHKVLTNLLLNAREACSPQGRVEVRTLPGKGVVVLTVSDDGCGMSPEFMARSLFKPFQTTKKQGLGIGLFHSKKIVEAHGGRIEVESEAGIGTTFKVILPAQADEPRT